MQAAKRMKRFTLVALAVGLALILLVGSALAIVGPVYNSGISTLKLNEDDLSRTAALSGSWRYGMQTWTSGFSASSGSFFAGNLQATSASFDAASYGQFGQTFRSFSGNKNTLIGPCLVAPSGGYLDITIPVTYLADDYNRLILSGTVGASPLYVRTVYGGVTNSSYARPVSSSLDLLINGEIVQSFARSGSYYDFAGFVFDFDFDISSVTLRYRYSAGTTYGSSGQLMSSDGTCQVNCRVEFTDNAVLSAEYIAPETPPYQTQLNTIIGYLRSQVSYLDSILDALGSMTNVTQIMDAVQTIITPSGADQDAADQFDQQIQDKITEADQIQDTLDSLEKPEPTEIVPEISDYVSDADLQSFTGTLTVIFDNSAVVSMMMISLSLALVAYVLFGKR